MRYKLWWSMPAPLRLTVTLTAPQGQSPAPPAAQHSRDTQAPSSAQCISHVLLCYLQIIIEQDIYPKNGCTHKPVCTHKYIYTNVFRDVTHNIPLHPIFLSKHQHVLHRKPAVTGLAQGRGGNKGILGSLQPEDSSHVPGHQSLTQDVRMGQL